MIRYFQRNSKTKLKPLKSYSSKCWVYIEAPTEQEIKLLTSEFGLDAGHLLDALDEDEMPRLESEPSGLYLFTRFPFTNEDLQLETATLLLILDKEKLISISAYPLPRFAKFMQEQLEFETTHPDQLMLIIMRQIVEQFDDFLTQISHQIKTIRDRLRVEQISNQDFVSFVVIVDELNDFLSAMNPTNSILRRLLINKHLNLSEKDRELIDDLLLSNEQSIEAAKSNIKSVVNIREAYTTIMSNNLNRIIRVLTVLTVILAIPTLIASLYGMNVKVPFEFGTETFGAIVIMSIVISAGLIVYFRHKDWL
jgi:magnesium transporter